MTAPAPEKIERHKLLTLEQVAADLQIPVGWLGRWLGKHPRDDRDRPLYRVACRKKLFTPQQVQLVIEALPCPPGSFRPAKAKLRAGRVAISDVALAEALALCREKPKKKR
jgi:hypothetical protein